MSKATRLIQLLHELRMHAPPVTATVLAQAMNVSERTIYRDIDALRAAGAVIDGEAGFGYTLTEDPALPPQMFSHDEIEALVLGLREVREIADPALAVAAESALAKLRATLPDRLKSRLEHAVLYAKRFHDRPEISIDPAQIRKAAWEELALDIAYVDQHDRATNRRVYPLSIIYFDQTLVLMAWCCLRQADRMFRLDRIQTIETSDESFRPNRVSMLRDALARINENHPPHGKL